MKKITKNNFKIPVYENLLKLSYGVLMIFLLFQIFQNLTFFKQIVQYFHYFELNCEISAYMIKFYNFAFGLRNINSLASLIIFYLIGTYVEYYVCIKKIFLFVYSLNNH